MSAFQVKRIADPVHGTIGLSELETRVIGTRVFQRLRNIQHLGLAHLVFPAADYSRLSHSIGVCHVTGLILENLRNNGVPDISEQEIQLYRLAGLLHDIGHYPFSHPMEDAIANHYTRGLFATDEPGSFATDEPVKFFKHERVSKHIVIEDRELSSVLISGGYPPEDVCGIFTREKPLRFANLIDSDLDADRIDYLLRTAHHTGLPYGSVDLAYLLSQLRVDSQNRLCLTAKAMRTAEHFLLCRYFDYQQVTYHKTVAGMEWLLKDVLAALLETKMLECTAAWVKKAIASGEWFSFDETCVSEKIKQAASNTRDTTIRQKARALGERTTPKLLIEVEHIDRLSDKHSRFLQVSKQLVRERIPAWAEKYQIPESAWHLWEPRITTLTKIGSQISVSSAMEPLQGEERDKARKDRDRYDQSIRILDEGNSSSCPIMEKSSSLMNVLADHAMYAFRLYVLPLEGKPFDTRLVRAEIRSEVPSLEWR